MIRGLLTQRADKPAPRVGQKLPLLWQERVGRSGKPWIKVNNARLDTGQMCEIMSVASTDFQDDRGNVSFNVEFAPVEVRVASGPRSVAGSSPAASHPTIVPVTHDDPRHHVMRAANLLKMCHDAAKAVIGDDYDMEDARTLFIEASGRRSDDGVTWWSYTDQMPDKPIMKPVVSDDDDEIPM